jgi:hypothetical protein
MRAVHKGGEMWWSRMDLLNQVTHFLPFLLNIIVWGAMHMQENEPYVRKGSGICRFGLPNAKLYSNQPYF